jgi:hypothetical protein
MVYIIILEVIKITNYPLKMTTITTLILLGWTFLKPIYDYLKLGSLLEGIVIM